MKKFLFWTLSLFVSLYAATAIADLTVKDGNNVSQTIVNYVCQTTKMCSATAIIDSTGANVAAVKAGNTAGTTDVAVVVSDPNVLAAVNASVPAGTNLIGDVNLRQGGTALSTTNGAYFNQLQGNAVLSATNPGFSAPIPTTSGGLTVYNVQPTASDNHANIKNGAGQVYKVDVFNNSATVNYIRLYNAASGFNGCNSATNLVWQGIIPASTSGAGLSSSWDLGIAFGTGISICVTSGYATNDTTNATASALIVNVGYK